jgi:DDE superfamily endonuclease
MPEYVEDFKRARLHNCRGNLPEWVDNIATFLIDDMKLTPNFVAYLFGVTRSTMVRRLDGTTAANRRGGITSQRALTLKRARKKRCDIIKKQYKLKSPRRVRLFHSVRRLAGACKNDDGGSAGFSKSNINRILKASGVTFKHCIKGPNLTDEHVCQRLLWTEWLLNRIPASKPLVFVDESWIDVQGRGGNHCGYYSFPGEEDDRRDLVDEKNNYPLKLMIFGAIGVDFRFCYCLPVRRRTDTEEGWTLTGPRYVQTCLSPIVPHLLEKGAILLQDNAKCHICNHTKNYLGRKGVETLLRQWPPHSADLNPVENLWSIYKRAVREHAPRTLDELKQACRDVWNDRTVIPDELLNKLVRSFHGRCQRVFEAQGHFTSGHGP